jgi:hypothetical protein
MAGYAAAAFSIAAPGAELVLVAPRATQDPTRAGWDTRHRAARRIDFTDRYGYAPDMIESAEKVWLIHDPLNPPDAMHAALFQRPWVTPLFARHTGEATEDALTEMQALDRILEAVMEKRFSPEFFAWLWRGRRSNADYLRRPDDWHLHLRDGAMLRACCPKPPRHFARAIIMPNLVPPVVTGRRPRLPRPHPGRPARRRGVRAPDDALPDRNHRSGRCSRRPASGLVKAVKLYPAGATTNSHPGCATSPKVMPVLEKMAGSACPCAPMAR